MKECFLRCGLRIFLCLYYSSVVISFSPARILSQDQIFFLYYISLQYQEERVSQLEKAVLNIYIRTLLIAVGLSSVVYEYIFVRRK
jgi:hypothetical protein